MAGTDGVSLEAEKWADIREALGVAPYEMLNLQPTRVVQRKSIEHAIERVHQLGLKAKLSFPLFGAQTYVSAHYAGLVADGGQHHKQFGVTDPSRLPYSGLGNKEEYEFGMLMNFGNVMVFPRFMYRDNLVDANPFIEPGISGGILNPGLSPRDRDNDPFAVLGKL